MQKHARQFESLSVWVDTPLDTRKLLDGIHGFVEPGTLVSLLGPSGAGKSTRKYNAEMSIFWLELTIVGVASVLNALAGRNGDGVVRGRILIDGQTPQDEFYRTTGYVQQFDHHGSFFLSFFYSLFPALTRSFRRPLDCSRSVGILGSTETRCSHPSL